MSILKIQEELKAPKNQRNEFGKYNYRSAEDIIEAVKPIAHKYGCYVNLTDHIVEVGGRIYVKATATIFDAKTRDTVAQSVGWAREEETKKGMDSSQITGAASSYARKYALNGLLAIDDTKDSDATNTHGKEEVVNKTPIKIAPKKLDVLNEKHKNWEVVKKALAEGKTNIERLKGLYIVSEEIEAKLKS